MEKFIQKIFKEIDSTLVEIKAGDIMALYATIWGAVLIGAVIILAQINLWAGVILLIFSPIPVFIMTVITKSLVTQFRKGLGIVEEAKNTGRNKSPKVKPNEQDDSNNPFLITARPPVNDNRPSTMPRSASLTIENMSPDTLKKCFITIDHIFDEDGNDKLYSRERRLSWSSGQPQNKGSNKRLDKEIDIVIKDPAVVDVAETRVVEGYLDCFLTTVWFEKGSQPFYVGIYEIHVTAHGNWKRKDVFKRAVFILRYNGKNDISIEEKS